MPGFAEKLKELRTENSITQKELATTLNVSQNAIFNWENGKREPSIEMLKKIAEYFHVSLDYLMGPTVIMTDEGVGLVLGKTNTEQHYYLNEETAQIAQEIFENPDLRSLFDMSRKMPPERLRTHIDFIQRLYEQETGEHIELTYQPLKRGVSYDNLTSEPQMDEERPNIEGHTED